MDTGIAHRYDQIERTDRCGQFIQVVLRVDVRKRVQRRTRPTAGFDFGLAVAAFERDELGTGALEQRSPMCQRCRAAQSVLLAGCRPARQCRSLDRGRPEPGGPARIGRAQDRLARTHLVAESSPSQAANAEEGRQIGTCTSIAGEAGTRPQMFAPPPDAMHHRRRKRAGKERSEPRLTNDDNSLRTLDDLGQATGEHDFVADSLFAVNEDCPSRER